MHQYFTLARIRKRTRAMDGSFSTDNPRETLSHVFPAPLSFSFYDPPDFSLQVPSSYWHRVRSELSNYAAIIRPRLYISVNYGAVAARRSDRERRRKREVRRQWGPRRNNGAAPYSWGTVQRYKQYRGGARLIGSWGQPLWELMTLFTPLHPPAPRRPDSAPPPQLPPERGHEINFSPCTSSYERGPGVALRTPTGFTSVCYYTCSHTRTPSSIYR